jgi:pyruvate/2-oxoglutarate/acetoin dehydrogenase E1 component
MPATPADAYSMLKWALQESAGPTVYLPHSLLLENEEEVDFAAPALPVGRARVARAGRDVTLVAHSVMVPRALAAADLLAHQGFEAEVIDMRSLCPLDRETMVRSVSRTGRAVIADECHFSFGAGAELAATLAQEAFGSLKAPVHRVATPDAPIPYSPVLESALVVTAEKIAAGALAVLKFGKA